MCFRVTINRCSQSALKCWTDTCKKEGSEWKLSIGVANAIDLDLN